MSGRPDAATVETDGAAGERPSPLVWLYPWLILAALAVAAAAALTWLNAFTAVEVNDTKGYAEFDFGSLTAALGQRRTPGYPLLLAAIHALTGSFSILPAVHFAIFCAGVALFQAGLLAQGGSRAASPWIAGSTFSAYILGRYMATLATDTTAAALGIASCGALLLWTAGRPRAWPWAVLLAFLIATAWLVRPIMLSLAPFAVIAAPLLQLRRCGSDATIGRLTSCFLLATAIAVMPVLAWCGLRYWAVGKFGVVSFGGYNLIGVAGQFLDEELVQQLPQHLRPLAEASLARKNQLPPDAILMPNEPILNYTRMESNYDVMINDIFTPVADELYGEDVRLANSRLRQLAVAIVRQRPGWYAVWLIKASRQALRVSCEKSVVNPVTGILVVLTIVVTMLGIIKRWWRSESQPRMHESTEIVSLLFMLSMLYASLNLAMVTVVCPPLARMTDAACVLFPALIAAVFLDRLTFLLRSGETEP